MTVESIVFALKDISVEPTPYETETRCASVIVVLCDILGECHVLLNKRSAELRRHPNQVCFPGGMRDPGDRDVVETALRECEEETGLRREHLTVQCVMPPLMVYEKPLQLTPVVASVPPDTFTTYNFVKCESEVADIFHVPLSTFLLKNPLPDSTCYLESHIIEERELFNVHHFNVKCPDHRMFDIMGITAHLCTSVAVLGLKQPTQYTYKIPTGYCIMTDKVKEKINQLTINHAI